MAERGAPLGNNNAGKGKRWSDAIERAIAAWPDPPDDTNCADVIKGLNKAAHSFVSKMMDDNSINFFREFGDRLDGKATQGVELSGDADNPVVISTVKRIIVDPKDGT